MAFSQINVDSISHVNYQQLHGADLNDLWGYEDETGIEYAVVGTSKGTSIVSLENPASPVEVFWLPGTESIWRDVAIHGDYAYISTEALSGLTIIDLSPLPQSNVLSTSNYQGPSGNPWQSAHTIYADENGYAYVMGANRGNGGVIILDIATSPMNPIEVGTFDNWYVHDGYMKNDTMYLSHIADGFFSIVDATDKSNPILLGTKTTPNQFTHTTWTTQDDKYVLTTDEVSDAYIAVYNVEDPLNIYEVDRIQSSPGSNVIPHNVFVRGNYVITSYYSDGIVIHDITHPNNLVEVGNYDTYPGQTSGFDGCWGVYPFFNSGLIAAADITEGLFILQPTYSQAAYLKGNVTEQGSGNPINLVNVQIVTNNQVDLSNTMGDYATGILNPGTYDVIFSKVGYFPDTFQVNLQTGIEEVLNVQLLPIPPFNLTIKVVESGSGTPINNAEIKLVADLITHQGVTNGIGEESFSLYYQELYDLTIGKWGYITKCVSVNIDNSTVLLQVEMEKGYYDDFEFDFAWVVTGNAQTGVWTRAIPYETTANPGVDAVADCGEYTFVTGNYLSTNSDVDDIDGGTTKLYSPTMDLTSYTDPHLNYARWFYCFYGFAIDDTLKIYISNGSQTVLVDLAYHDPSTDAKWIPKSIRISDYINITNNMNVQVHASDLNEVNITEAAFDYFFISNENVLQTNDLEAVTLKIYPNPFDYQLKIEGLEKGDQVLIYDINGRLIQEIIFTEAQSIDTKNLDQGIYYIKCKNLIFRAIKS